VGRDIIDRYKPINAPDMQQVSDLIVHS